MNTQKGFASILIILLGLVVIGGGAYVYNQKNDLRIFGTKEIKEVSVLVEENTNIDDYLEEKDGTDTNTITKDKENSIKIETDTNVIEKIDSKVTTNNTPVTVSTTNATTDLWSIFDQVTLALKNKDIASLNKFSYTQITPEESAEFIEFIPFLLEMNLGVNKNEYVNKWQNDKQAIFSKNPVNTVDGYEIDQIMFIKKDNDWKLLSISSKGFIGVPTPDSDKDGLTDSEELCTASHNPRCIKTDPNKRDTNGDGWWDGIRQSMNDF